MSFRTCASLAVLALTLTVPAAFAQADAAGPAPTRIAVVDVQRVFAETDAGKAAMDKLRQVQEQRVATARQMDQEIRSLDADINTKRAGLSATRIAEMQQQLAEKRAALERFAQEAEQEIAMMRDRELQVIERRTKPVIDALARELNLAAIFNKFESGLIYADDRLDLTAEVITRVNATK